MPDSAGALKRCRQAGSKVSAAMSERLPHRKSGKTRYQKHRKHKSPLPKRLRVMADYGSSGIWIDGMVGPFRHAMAEHRDLGLPDDLAAQFEAWINLYWARADKKSLDLASFNAEGRALAIALKAFVGSETEVVFEPVTSDDRPGPPEVIA